MPISPSDHTILTTTKANLDVRLERFGLYTAYPPADTSYKLNLQESDFYLNFIDKVSSSGSISRYAVIAFANEATNYEVIVGHEINHASFYLQPTYKATVMEFSQKSVSPKDKLRIRSILGKLYNAKDDNIIVDEFQAYLTQMDEKNNPLVEFIPKYKRKLMKKLNLL